MSNKYSRRKLKRTINTLVLIPITVIIKIAQKIGIAEQFMHMTMRVVHPFNQKRKNKPFAGYIPNQGDVFVCTYPKSGTNWMMQIALQITHFGKADFENIYAMIPWPDAAKSRNKRYLDPGTSKDTPTGLRVIKTHLESDYVPYSPEAKYIILMRDPKDIFVSSYYFRHGMMKLFGVSYDAEGWLEHFTSKYFFFDSWPAHIASFWSWRNRPNVLLLTFSELKHDLHDCCQRVADLLKISLTGDQMDLVLEKSSFQYMKVNDHKFIPRAPAFRNSKPPTMVRNGQIGVAGELLDQEQQARLDAFCISELKRLGSDFPYETRFIKR